MCPGDLTRANVLAASTRPPNTMQFRLFPSNNDGQINRETIGDSSIVVSRCPVY